MQQSHFSTLPVPHFLFYHRTPFLLSPSSTPVHLDQSISEPIQYKKAGLLHIIVIVF